jgi:transglutaminase-like putative cysteine protease
MESCAQRRLADRIRLFRLVRGIPYATDGAHTEADLLAIGRGDCLAKSAYLIAGFQALGYRAHRVRWLYELPPWPAEVSLLPSRQDVHSAAEVLIDGRWVLVDATIDPPLAGTGLIICDWDGHRDTATAFPPTGPVWRPGAGPEPRADWESGSPPLDPAAGLRYQVAFNHLLELARNAGTATRS